jgi:hypothetical protein
MARLVTFVYTRGVSAISDKTTRMYKSEFLVMAIQLLNPTHCF